jgi:4-hydroxy-tetrahydrodipicolinate synthase
MKGCFTAIITPFTGEGVDHEGLHQLCEFQIQNRISGILAAGTTGESPTLNWEEHNRVIKDVSDITKNRCICIAGTGSNNTRETLEATQHAVAAGADAILLVDPYYNGPSSLEIRKEYIAPVADAFPQVEVIPYVIPGRTGAQLLPEDLAFLNETFKNVSTVKEATGSFENMKQTRSCCGPDFSILSGDDPNTYDMMLDADINAAGVISVASNVAPGPIAEMVRLLEAANAVEAKILNSALTPLFNLVTIKTQETTKYGDVLCRARNPIGIKTLMTILGMPSGGCRRPLGKMTRNGLDTVIAVAKKVQANNPELFEPIADFFGVDIDERLSTPANWEGLAYDAY